MQQSVASDVHSAAIRLQVPLQTHNANWAMQQPKQAGLIASHAAVLCQGHTSPALAPGSGHDADLVFPEFMSAHLKLKSVY